jgi:hypothetical protein
VSIVEAFAAYGQILPSNMFVQAQGGTEQPWSTRDVLACAVGGSASARACVRDGPRAPVVANPRAAGRSRLRGWREDERGSAASGPGDAQQTQHVRFNLGFQIPVNNTSTRSKQVVFYFLWDWFDGGLLDGWK